MSDHRPAQDQTTEQLPDSNTHLTGRAFFRHHMDPSSHGHTTWRDSCWWRFVLRAPHTCWPQPGCRCSHSDAHSKPSPGCALTSAMLPMFPPLLYTFISAFTLSIAATKAHMLWDSFTDPASCIWARRNMLVTIWNQMPTNEECGTLTSAPKYYIFYYIIYYISPCSVSSGTKERLSLAPTFTDWEDFSLCCYLIRFEHFKRKQLPKAWPSSHGRDNPT